MKFSHRVSILLALLAALTGCNESGPSSPAPANAEVTPNPMPAMRGTYTPAPGKTPVSGAKEVDWLALVSEDDLKRMESGDIGELSHDTQEQSFSTNMKARQAQGFKAISRFDKQLIKIAGYSVPLEQNEIGEVSELLFVPYYGACIHVPPPPANQIIYVTLKKPSAELNMFDAYWLEGTLLAQAHESDLAHAAYRMENAVLIPWE